ncbi:MAG: trypsin-like peptidase domain-containing protein [Acidimicrobiales bacterium]|jgi:S1-C subfamily serine protease
MSQIGDQPDQGSGGGATGPFDLTRPVIDAEPVTGQIPRVGAGDGGAGAGEGSATGRRGRREQRRAWRREDRARRYAARNSVRFPIFTRSVLLWMLIFALTGVAFGASGAFWWANFNSQVSDLRSTTEDFEERSAEAQASIEELRRQALDDINAALGPLEGFLAETQVLQLAQLFSPAVYSVATLDEEGRPSVGTAFAVISDDRETFFVTSYTTVKAATVRPGPEVIIRKGTEETKAEVWNWDAERDLALIRAPKGGVQVLEWISDDAAAKALGGRIFPVSGLGGAGASLTTGVVIDQSSVGFQHTAPLGPAFQGGPIVTVDGKVLGVASLTYEPLGFDPGEIHFGVPINQVCQRLLQCGGADRTPSPQGGR